MKEHQQVKSFSNGAILESYSPVDGQLIAKLNFTAADYEKVMESATEASKHSD
jgi:aldehyde dehydrogenase (NAD+)